MKTRKRVLRGFTLIEMIIVLAIIAIIAGVFIPAINRYITRSRLNASNADARVIFNSLQTICQEIEFSDRTLETSELYGVRYYNSMYKNDELKIETSDLAILAENGEITKVMGTKRFNQKDAGADWHYYNSNPGAGSDVYDSTLLTRLDDTTGATNDRLMQRMYRLYDSNGDTTWCAFIEGYLVKGVICANDSDSKYLGGYPLKTTEKGGFMPRKATVSGCPYINAGGSFSMEDVMTGVGLGAGGDSPYGFYFAMKNYVEGLVG